jgi:Polyketide cyclase / dehydrase and lipid transport
MVQTKSSETITIGSSPDRVYNLLIDLGRVGETGPLFASAEWLGGATGPHAGAHFVGRGADGTDNECRVLRAMPGEEWAFKTDITSESPATWRYELERTDDGCEVTVKWDSATPTNDVTDSLSSLKRLAEG